MRAQASAAARPAGLLPALARAACCASSARPPPSAPPQCPLILGIWGGKGQGKTFQVCAGWGGVPGGTGPRPGAAGSRAPGPCRAAVPSSASTGCSDPRLPRPCRHPTPPPPARPQCNLAYKKLGITPIVMSAGELESGNAGEPAKLIRQRYRCGPLGRGPGGLGWAGTRRAVRAGQPACGLHPCLPCLLCVPFTSRFVASVPPVTQRGLRHHQEGQGGRSSQFCHVFQSLGVFFRRCPRHSRPLRFLFSGGAQSCPAVMRPPVPI